MAYIYRHIRLDNNQPFYIGIGEDLPKYVGLYKRANNKVNRNKYWKNIINKTKYKVDIILDNLTWKEACEKEIEFISLYGRKDLKKGTLVNMTDGGDGNKNPKSEITKLRISQSMKKPKSENHKQNMSKARKGIKRVLTWNVGSKKGINKTEEHKQNMRKRVLQYDLNNILIKEWLSITEATNSGFKGVGNVLGGRANTTGGFIWTYKNNK